MMVDMTHNCKSFVTLHWIISKKKSLIYRKNCLRWWIKKCLNARSFILSTTVISMLVCLNTCILFCNALNCTFLLQKENILLVHNVNCDTTRAYFLNPF